MSLKSTPVSQSLDRKLQIFGFEVPDLFLIFLVLAILNFIFGNTESKLLLVWLPTLIIGAFLRISKHGKPENHLLHVIKFQLRPVALSAFLDPAEYQSHNQNKEIEESYDHN